MTSRECELAGLLSPAVGALGHELLGVQLLREKGDPLLRVYIDNEAGVTVDDCARVSEQVSGVLDVSDPIAGHYTLEVSSPGLDRPLFTSEQYRQYVGHRVSVALHGAYEGRRKLKGELAGVEGESLRLLEGDDEWSIPLAMVRMTRLVPEL